MCLDDVRELLHRRGSAEETQLEDGMVWCRQTGYKSCNLTPPLPSRLSDPTQILRVI